MSWQPIETAPKDGTAVDLWVRSGRRIPDAYWIEGEGGFWFSNGMPIDAEPTHWMPLPEPPEAAG